MHCSGRLRFSIAIVALLLAGGVGASETARKQLRSGQSSAAVRRRDAARDAKAPAKPLPRGRTVYRYTTKRRAQEETKKGIPPGAHMTSRAPVGRPPGAGRAKQQYGLNRRPEVRETVHVPQGQPAKLNKALGGAPGKGELTSSRRIPPKSIKKVVPLKK